MPFNPCPEVAAARNFAKKFDKQMVIVLSLDARALRADSYGRNPMLCKEAQRLGDVAYKAIMKHYYED